MRKCTTDDLNRLYLPTEYVTRQELILKAHIDNDAWYCPNAFDLSFWGMKDDLDSKTLTLTFQPVSAAAVANKELLLLINDKKVVYGEDQLSPEVKSYVNMRWLPMSLTSPILNTITYTRERVYQA